MIISNWSDEHTRKFQNETLRVKHDLISTGLFSDEALSELLDKHPKDQLDVCAISNHPIYQHKFRTGDVRDVDGKTLIEAAKDGTIWMNLRKAMNIHPEYSAVLDKMYGEIATLTESILPDEEYETFMYKVTEDYLPHDPSMEEETESFDLKEGEMITWALNRPHRVENQSYCVSVTTEYSTHESRVKNAAMYTNAVLRQKFGLSPSWQSASQPEKYIKAGIGKILRRIGILDTLQPEDMVSFTIDKSTPGFIRDVKPYLRQF